MLTFEPPYVKTRNIESSNHKKKLRLPKPTNENLLTTPPKTDAKTLPADGTVFPFLKQVLSFQCSRGSLVVKAKDRDWAMDRRKFPGPDGIYGLMIDLLGPHGMQKLLDIFNFSWKIGRLPRDWKRAIIIPIPKPKKDTSTSASYRPIALTFFVCKFIERLVLARLNVHLNINSMLPS
ncbi:putative RNA-directed DNA polymerase from transposon BS [Trichonephila clavipes]|nr:putative RNA-directed DNA polymerase from transposon BS [Trichonephila clavipes]